VSAVLIFGVIYATLLRPRPVQDAVLTGPFAGPFRAKGWLRMIGVLDIPLPWTIASVVLIAAVYGPLMWAERVTNAPLPGMRVW
jgi:hypothetical protein